MCDGDKQACHTSVATRQCMPLQQKCILVFVHEHEPLRVYMQSLPEGQLQISKSWLETCQTEMCNLSCLAAVRLPVCFTNDIQSMMSHDVHVTCLVQRSKWWWQEAPLPSQRLNASRYPLLAQSPLLSICPHSRLAPVSCLLTSACMWLIIVLPRPLGLPVQYPCCLEAAVRQAVQPSPPPY